MKHGEADSYWGGIIKSLGLVFGDIGTSPIYTLTVIFALTKPTRDNVFGILSLIFWTMTILVTVEYAWLAMSLGRKGEGGTIVLQEILVAHAQAGPAAGLRRLSLLSGGLPAAGRRRHHPGHHRSSRRSRGWLLIPGLERTSSRTS